MNFIIAGFVIMHIFCTFIFTQKLYSKKTIPSAILISLIFSICISLLYGKKIQFAILNASMILFYYALLLLIISKYYHKVNSYFISKGKISKLYQDKDYTFVNQTEEGKLWDTNLSSEPSWLDSTISFCLIVLPVLLFAFLNFIFSLIFNPNYFQGS